jgi:GAF domain-containing protein
VLSSGTQEIPGAAGKISSRSKTPISESFCQYVVAEEAPLVISDARLDSRVSDKPSVSAGAVVAYMGYPLRNSAGKTIGSVCAIDTEPRAWTEADLEALRDVAHATTAEVIRRETQWRLEWAWTVSAVILIVAIITGLIVLT